MRNEKKEFVQLLNDHINLFNESEIEEATKLYDLAVNGNVEAMMGPRYVLAIGL